MLFMIFPLVAYDFEAFCEIFATCGAVLLKLLLREIHVQNSDEKREQN